MTPNMTRKKESPESSWVFLTWLAALALLTGIAARAGVLEDVRNQFNKDKGAPRLVVLVSPTWMGCLGGAQWIYDYVLKKNPSMDLKVYTIWYSMIRSDTPEAFPSAKKVMPDKRVLHYWDSKKETGKWFKEVVPQLPHTGPVQWDAYYLYGPEAEWPEIKLEQEPGPRLEMGRTILQARKKLREKIEQLKNSGSLSAPQEAESNVPAAATQAPVSN